ncbi:hypothetical protein CPB83DRAFT_854492 [Crepidotus variabilis]|uniref:Uncharacterized protein n=1 Tax=Crepidotus variabilis TaxID=179855 RepID=A0A9P6EGL6_9AGAR|nr:hypothetical protein CPB83DRAFT_854492 [Crepidotus variabilis]
MLFVLRFMIAFLFALTAVRALQYHLSSLTTNTPTFTTHHDRMASINAPATATTRPSAVGTSVLTHYSTTTAIARSTAIMTNTQTLWRPAPDSSGTSDPSAGPPSSPVSGALRISVGQLEAFLIAVALSSIIPIDC